jgi:hypothetical protein
MFARILAIPLPLNSFYKASASAISTALILVAYPSFLAAIFFLYETFMSFIDLRISSGGEILLI